MSDVTRFDPLAAAPLPTYGAWTDDDYRALGFRSGLEVHQQLLTRRKLFCRCPAGRYSDRHDVEILRHMRPTLSEMGEYDGTALMEFKTRKDIIYRLASESVCTYEMDDAPPFEMDPEATDIAIRISLLLGLQVVDEIHIARKQYLDGSIPTGFQRTAIIGVHGKVPLDGRELGIRQLSLEEDSCREVSDRGHVRVYRTDRLGMPLIETVTEPELETPERLAAACELLRRLVRVTGLVRTGAGAAREDVNVSIRGGTRIEIKGVPSIREIPRLAHNEALRQRSLLAIRDELARRGVTAESLGDDLPRDVTDLLQQAGYPPLRAALDEGGRAMVVPLPGFHGLLATWTQPHTRFLKEFSDRIRVIACLDTLPNVLCSTGGADLLSSAEWQRLQRACGVGDDVPLLLVWGPPRDAATAAGEILIRAREATVGVPEETRQALDDGTTGFERILPGPSRMYPDTDLPPVVVDPERVARLAADLPAPPWERLGQLRRAGVGEELARRLALSRAYDLFMRLLPRLGDGEELTPTGLASILLDRDLPRPTGPAAVAWWEEAVDRVVAGRTAAEALWCAGGELPDRLPDDAVRGVLEEVLAAAPADWPTDPDKRHAVLMGAAMTRLRGRARGRDVARLAREVLR